MDKNKRANVPRSQGRRIGGREKDHPWGGPRTGKRSTNKKKGYHVGKGGSVKKTKKDTTWGQKDRKKEQVSKKNKKGYHTGYSHVVSNRSTKPASTRLTSVIGRELVL